MRSGRPGSSKICRGCSPIVRVNGKDCAVDTPELRDWFGVNGVSGVDGVEIYRPLHFGQRV